MIKVVDKKNKGVLHRSCKSLKKRVTRCWRTQSFISKSVLADNLRVFMFFLTINVNPWSKTQNKLVPGSAGVCAGQEHESVHVVHLSGNFYSWKAFEAICSTLFRGQINPNCVLIVTKGVLRFFLRFFRIKISPEFGRIDQALLASVQKHNSINAHGSLTIRRAYN